MSRVARACSPCPSRPPQSASSGRPASASVTSSWVHSVTCARVQSVTSARLHSVTPTSWVHSVTSTAPLHSVTPSAPLHSVTPSAPLHSVTPSAPSPTPRSFLLHPSFKPRPQRLSSCPFSTLLVMCSRLTHQIYFPIQPFPSQLSHPFVAGPSLGCLAIHMHP